MSILLAVDGNSLTHRAYHAFMGRDGKAGRINRHGQAVWAVEGLLGFLGQLAEKARADAIIVGFDDIKDSYRKGILPEYKAGRSAKTEELITQLALGPETLESYGIKVATFSGLEADDTMASASVWAKDNKHRCVIATSDRDSFALIDTNTTVLRMVNGGVSQAELYTPERLFERYGIHPSAYLLYAALRGDPSDNLPGVTGIGEKTAAKIVDIAPTFAAFQEELEKPQPFTGILSAAVLKKLTSAEALEKLKLNTKMMSPVYSDIVSEQHVTRLPLDVARIARESERTDVRMSVKSVSILGRSNRAVAVPPLTATPVAPLAASSEDGEEFSSMLNPTPEQTTRALRAYWTGLGGTYTDAAAPALATEKPLPNAPRHEKATDASHEVSVAGTVFFVPNPRPAKSLLVR